MPAGLPVSSTITTDNPNCSQSVSQLCAPANLQSYLWNTGATTQCITTSVSGGYYVIVTNASGCQQSSPFIVNCSQELRCGNNGKKILVCHATGSASNQYNQLCLSVSGAENHILHHPNDYIGTCRPQQAKELLNTHALQLSAYPNPVSDKLNLAFESEAGSNYKITLTDVTGRTILDIKDKAEVEFTELTLPMPELSPGIYYLKIVSGDKTAGLTIRK